MASSRVEGLIASLPALRHNATYVETDQVRMVYQPLDTLLLVLITTTSSNILLDLHSLDLVKQLLNELGATTKQTINLHKFELLGLLDELITNGYQNNVTLAQLRSISLMESHDERIQAELDKKKELYAKEETKKKAKQLDLLKRDARRQQQQQQPQYPSQPQYQPQQPVQQPFQTQYQPPVSAEPATASRGMKLGSKSKQDTVLDSLRHDHAIRDMPARTHAPVANPVHQEPLAPIDPIHVQVAETLSATVDRHGSVSSLELAGTMTLTINDPASTSVKLQVSHNADQQLQFKTHPNVDKALWASESLIALRDASRTYPLSQPLGILRWKGSLNHDRLPLSSNFFNLVTCWPSVTAQGQSVTIEYELNTEMTLNDLAISIPVASHPSVSDVTGAYHVEPHMLVWTVGQVTPQNASGSLEFSLDSQDETFPISVSFSAAPIADISVVGVMGESGPKEYKLEAKLVTENYQII